MEAEYFKNGTIKLTEEEEKWNSLGITKEYTWNETSDQDFNIEEFKHLDLVK